MIWLSISNVSPASESIAADSRPWAKLKRFWEFCRFYGEYQATPLWQRRQFILDYEKRNASNLTEQNPCR